MLAGLLQMDTSCCARIQTVWPGAADTVAVIATVAAGPAGVVADQSPGPGVAPVLTTVWYPVMLCDAPDEWPVAFNVVVPV